MIFLMEKKGNFSQIPDSVLLTGFFEKMIQISQIALCIFKVYFNG